MPQDPIGSLFANLANTLNAIAPHTMIPKMLASMTPQAPVQNGGEAAMAEGSGMPGVRERWTERTDLTMEELQAKMAADKAASIKSGYSVTGSTIFM